MADNCHMSEEQKLLEAIDAKNEEGGTSLADWNALMFGRIALALSQIVDRLDKLSEALDSFRPRWIDQEEPEMDKKQREELERAGIIYPAEKVKVYAPAAFSDEAIKKFREFTGLIDSVTAKLKETYGGEDSGRPD